MKPLSTYFSPEFGAAFAQAIPDLRAQIGMKPFNPHSATYGVGGNTFRAYTGWRKSPSFVYRQWAEGKCTQLDPQSLARKLKTSNGFQAWHEELAESLQSVWHKNQGRELSFAHQHKLIDLFVKWLSSHNFSSPSLSESFVAHANCALDSQTLSKLNECLSMALPLSRPSMGHVHCKGTYVFCQDHIHAFSSHFGGSRLLFDYFAWRGGG